jgi:hypothetical protein
MKPIASAALPEGLPENADGDRGRSAQSVRASRSFSFPLLPPRLREKDEDGHPTADAAPRVEAPGLDGTEAIA